MRQLTNTLVLICCILFALDARALGLSEIQVNSKLNEPLNAKINIYSIPKGSLSTLKVGLASPQAFQRAGLERPHVLTNLDFTVRAISKTEVFVQISTQKALREPFLNFIVEVTWSGGQLLREYTIFLDLPSRSRQAAHTKRSPPSFADENTPEESTNVKETSTNIEGDSYTIVKGDTLWKIAEKHRPPGVSVPEQMNRIFNANPNAFINKNKALLKVGEIIRIPGWANTERDTSPARSEDVTSRRTPAEEIDKPLISSNKSPERQRAQQQLKELENKITQLTEANVDIESENELLTTELEKTKDLLESFKKQLADKNNSLTLNAQQLAKLQAELEKEKLEKEKFKQEMVEDGADKPRVTQQPTAPDAIDTRTTNKPEPDVDKPRVTPPKVPDTTKPSAEQPDLTGGVGKPKATLPTAPDAAKPEPEPKLAAPSTGETPEVAAVSTPPERSFKLPDDDEVAVLKNLLKTQITQKLRQDEKLKEQLSHSKISPAELAELMAESGIDPLQEDSPEKVANLVMELESDNLQELPSPKELVASIRDYQQTSIQEFVKLTADLQVQQLQKSSPEEQAQFIAEIRGGPQEPEIRRDPPQEPSRQTDDPSLIKTTDEWVKQQVPGGWITVGGIVLFLLILTFFRRKRQKSSDTLDKFENTSEAPKTPGKKLQDNGVKAAYEDVREKFNGYMAQNQFGQAEDFVKSAIKRHPYNHEYQLMLLEIYATENKVEQFDKEAKVLHDAVNGQGPLWEKALELRKYLSPERELSQPDSSGTGAIVGATAIGAAAVAATTLGENERPNDGLVIPHSDEEEDGLLFASEEELNQDVNLSEELKGVDAYSDINRTDTQEYDEIQSSAETDDSSPDSKSPEDSTDVEFNLDDDLSGGDEGNLSNLSSRGLEDEFDLPSESGSEATVPDSSSSLSLDDEFDLVESAEEGRANENESSLELNNNLPLEDVGKESLANDDLSSLELEEDFSLESGQEGSATEDLSSLDLDIEEDVSLESGQEGSATEDLSSLDLDIEEDLSLESGQEGSATEDLSSLELELDEDFSSESPKEEENAVEDLSSLDLDMDEDLSLESSKEESAVEEGLSLDDDLSLDELLGGLDSDDTDNRK